MEVVVGKKVECSRVLRVHGIDKCRVFEGLCPVDGALAAFLVCIDVA